jgi:laminin alpha 3/5
MLKLSIFDESCILYFSAEKFKVGRNIKMSLSIKPRHPSGILVSVHGERDFMVLQMINGTIKFTVDNGKGPLYSSFRKETYDLCDGNWHTIRGTVKKRYICCFYLASNIFWL